MKLSKNSRLLSRVILPLAGGGAALAVAASGAQAAPVAPALNPDPMPSSFDFSDCPALQDGYQAAGSTCVSVVVTSGTFKLGNFDQAFTSPIRMTFASQFNKTTRKITPVFGKLRADKMPVIPGLFGDTGLTAVYAQPEYAGVFDQPTSTDFKIKIGLKIKLVNPVLGENCYLGSDSDPITLNLSTGTTNPPPPNTPISGEAATVVLSQPPLAVRSAKHVDNAFAVPGAHGCLFGLGLADWLVNQIGGTPAAAGNNAMVYNEYIASKPYTALGS
ncbi:hypothetical protein [Actinomadura atramentaria]|uniref:hypothetical protein n=1 Tax=Actinomadura atramentaria TaxID=1990 RepID=UPI00035DF5A3|nr:hypothetical protein [Actinomadura atramentaria]